MSDLSSAKGEKADIDQVAVTNRDFMSTGHGGVLRAAFIVCGDADRVRDLGVVDCHRPELGRPAPPHRAALMPEVVIVKFSLDRRKARARPAPRGAESRTADSWLRGSARKA